MDLKPKWAERQFDTFDRWVTCAARFLAPREGSVGEEVRAICVDTLGRRCHSGADFRRARDEGTFPVRFFWECEPVAPDLATRCTEIADQAVPQYRSGAASYSCGGTMARRWQAAWDAACLALGGDPADFLMKEKG